MIRTHDGGPPFPTGEHETTASLARGILAAACAPEHITCALCPAIVDKLDAHWHEELHDEVCEDCCPDCEQS